MTFPCRNSGSPTVRPPYGCDLHGCGLLITQLGVDNSRKKVLQFKSCVISVDKCPHWIQLIYCSTMSCMTTACHFIWWLWSAHYTQYLRTVNKLQDVTIFCSLSYPMTNHLPVSWTDHTVYLTPCLLHMFQYYESYEPQKKLASHKSLMNKSTGCILKHMSNYGKIYLYHDTWYFLKQVYILRSNNMFQKIQSWNLSFPAIGSFEPNP